ncbi:MAG: DUF2442 domain-containing protein [Rickettsiales bacterium]|nr:DUF2442 domain-containing protein [Rickettsiales bacterium]
MHKFNVIKAEYQDDYKISLTFDDGIKGVVDLKNFLFDQDCGVFTRLRDKEQFKNFTLTSHTLTWQDDLDLAPEFLRDLLKLK